MTDKQGHADPDKHGKDQYKRHVDGNIRVSGQIEVHPPPNANKEETPEDKKARTYRFLNFFASILTLIAVVVYSGLTFWQARMTRELIDDTTKQFQVDIRPYVTALQYWSSDTIRIAPNEKMRFNIVWVNYGRSPALKSIGTGKIFVGPDAATRAARFFAHLGEGPLQDVIADAPPETVIPPVIPSDPTKPLSGYVTISTDKELSQAEVDYILKTDESVAMVARIQYFDGYGKRYWSDICLSRYVNAQLPNCAIGHNEMR